MGWSICISKISENLIHLIFLDGFWIVHIPFASVVKFKFLSQFSIYHLLHYYYYYLLLLLFTPSEIFTSVFHWSLSDSKSPRVSRTLLSIQAIFNNAVVWMVSTHPPTSKSSKPFNNPLVTVPKAPIVIDIIVPFMFHSFFFNSLAKLRYLFFFFTLFQFYSVVSWGQQSRQFCKFSLFFYWFLYVLVFWSRLGYPCVCKSPIGVYGSHFLRQVLDCAYTIWSYGQI